MAKRKFKKGARLTVENVVEIATAAVADAGGVSVVAKQFAVSRQSIYRALDGDSPYHALLERIVREIGGVPIGDPQTQVVRTTTWSVL